MNPRIVDDAPVTTMIGALREARRAKLTDRNPNSLIAHEVEAAILRYERANHDPGDEDSESGSVRP